MILHYKRMVEGGLGQTEREDTEKCQKVTLEADVE